ncbi:MAG: DUF4445 domain-containing protein [Clostridia bacterium]|nr:DUF4445 domain-containing protein [Clostridia bacterium]
MPKITVYENGHKRIINAKVGDMLSDVLSKASVLVEHPCGGKGMCNKCTVFVDGESVLSCRYEIKDDIRVQIPQKKNIATAISGDETGYTTLNMCLCFDIGTTTLVLALVSKDEGKIIKTITRNNPQRAFAADVMSRIDYATKNGTETLHKKIIDELTDMIDELFDSFDVAYVDTLYVAGNTTMLHLFFNVPCSALGYAPYTPVFLQSKKMPADTWGIKRVGEIVSLPGISAFVGADVVAGLGYVGENEDGKYNFLIDLGTNAEVVLYSKDKLYCTAAAAGPCFEGVNISCGMSAVDGAIYSYTGKMSLVIGGGEPKGLCATGLIDAVSVLLDWEIIDETGFMEEKEFEIAKGVTITREDIRQFQLAKSAICSATLALMKKSEISYSDVGKVFVSGGFSSKMNLGNALKAGLLPKEFNGKIKTVNNSCMQGLVKFASGKSDLSAFLKNAEYVDLAKDEYFQDLFIENMMF